MHKVESSERDLLRCECGFGCWLGCCSMFVVRWVRARVQKNNKKNPFVTITYYYIKMFLFKRLAFLLITILKISYLNDSSIIFCKAAEGCKMRGWFFTWCPYMLEELRRTVNNCNDMYGNVLLYFVTCGGIYLEIIFVHPTNSTNRIFF